MTRAKDYLHLVIPQRFFVHQQRQSGDRHMYAARTRFIPDTILEHFEQCAWPPALNENGPSATMPAKRGHRSPIEANVTLLTPHREKRPARCHPSLEYDEPSSKSRAGYLGQVCNRLHLRKRLHRGGRNNYASRTPRKNAEEGATDVAQFGSSGGLTKNMRVMTSPGTA
jgi:hypothetical protein